MSALQGRLIAKQLGKPLLFLAVFVCIAWTLKGGAKDVSVIPAPQFSWLACAIAMFLVHYFVQAIGWHLILRALGQRTELRLNIRAWYLSMIARWMPGRIWYFTTRGYLSREAGVSLPACTVAMILELTYVLVGGMIATTLFAGALLRTVLFSAAGRYSLAIFVALLAGAGAMALRPAILARMCRFRLFAKVVRRVTGRDLDVLELPSMSTGRSLALLLYYTVFWIYSGVMFGVLARSFIPMNPARWVACIPSFAGSWLIGYLSIITPAGLGAREGAMWLMLRPVMPQTYAIILAVASRLMMLATELLSAGLTYVILRGAVTLPAPAESAIEERGLAAAEAVA